MSDLMRTISTFKQAFSRLTHYPRFGWANCRDAQWFVGVFNSIPILVVLTCLLLSRATKAYAQSPTGSGIPVPTGTWTMVLTEGPPPGRNGWEQLVYASALKQSLMLSIYHQFGSEPN